MGIVYILRSIRNKRYYVGSTNDLNRRLLEHNSGKTKSIRSSRPYELVYSQKYDSINIARKVEIRLKRLKSRIVLNKIISEGKINLGS